MSPPLSDASARAAPIGAQPAHGWLTGLADRVTLAHGWRRRLIAFACGAAGALALAPFDLFPAMAVPMVAAVWFIDGSARARDGGADHRVSRLASMGAAAAAGWWLGFGYFVAGLWWLGAAFLVEPDQFAWAMPFAVLGLPAVLALYPALGFALARAVWLPGAPRVIVLALCLSATEWLRATLFTGFPWNAYGMALGGNLVLGQAASLVGLHGLTLIAVALFAAPALDAGETPRRWLRSGLAASLAGLALLAAFGALRLSAGPVGDVARVKLRIMQANVAQDAKFDRANADRIVADYLKLSDRATSPTTTGIADVTHLIWPESSFPFILSRDTAMLTRFGAFLGPKTILVTGAARVEPIRTALPGEMRVSYRNAVQVVDGSGVILDSADKVHLVPFGEYLPFSSWLEKLGLRHFVHIPGGFDPGAYRRALNVPGLGTVSPLICYEAIFPGAVTPDSGERPGVLINVTNDAWFGRTTGPYQHLSQARLRTIEEGLPLVRAANTGISAIVDPYGRIRASLPLGIAGVLDGALPQPIPPTLFARHSRLAPAGLWLACALALLLAMIWAGRARRTP